MSSKGVLITGASSGLGKYIAATMPFHVSYDRDKPNEYVGPYDLIIHCACNPARDNLYEAYSNVRLLDELLNIQTKKFVFISSADVYPKGGNRSEDTAIDFRKIDNLYGQMKFLCEGIIRNREQEHLILRPTGLLGSYCRNNIIVRMLEGCDATTLREDSRMSYISHSYLYDLIFSELQGTYNISSLDSMTLGEINDMLGNPITEFGEYFGRFGEMDLSKLRRAGYTFPTCGRVIREFGVSR